MSCLTDHLHLAILTSPAPWNPSTEIIQKTLDSVWELLGERLRPTFYCDAPAPWVTNTAKYYQYVRLLEELGSVIRQDRWLGIAGQFKYLIAHLDKPLVFNVQHDWEFLRPRKVCIGSLLQLMLYPIDDIGIVRFHKRMLPQEPRYVDRQYYELNPEDFFDVPLISTDGWGDSPHIATAKHYRDKVLPNLSDDYQRDYGRYGVEGPVWRAYQRDIRKRGFAEAWSDWGSCLYGRFGDGAYIRHLGGDARQWRKKSVRKLQNEEAR